MTTWRLRQWLALALVMRVVSAATHSTPGHLDEWYQTVEFGNWLAHGFMSYTQEFGLHLRNLSWPWVLSLALKVAHWIDPGSPGLRVFFVNLCAGLIDLGMVWGWWQLLEKERLPDFWRRAGMLFILFLPFLAADSVRPSTEHISVALFFVCLGLIVRERFGWAGVAAAAVGGVKFTSGLLSLGVFIALAFRAWKERRARPFLAFSGGAIAGLALFSIPDWIVYGRPWESAWMFLQYNVFSGLSSLKFGEQGAGIYLPFLREHWGKVLAPMTVLLVLGMPRGFLRGWKGREPWFFAFVFHFVPHLLVPHKEPRFIAPVELLLAWAGFLGVAHAFPGRAKFLNYVPSSPLRGLFGLYFFVLALAFARGLWGETWAASQTWFEVDRHLKAVPGTCAIITVQPARSALLPWSTPDRVPDPAVATLQLSDLPSFDEELRTSRLVWVERAPQCVSQSVVDARVLLHMNVPRNELHARSCEILPSGILAWVPRGQWPLFLDRGWVRGIWYSCPVDVLAAFKLQTVRHLIARGVHRYESLPGIGIRGWDFFELGRKHSGDPAPDDEAL